MKMIKFLLINLKSILVLFAYATTVLGYIWLVAISLIFLLIAIYKCFQSKYNGKEANSNQPAEIINNDQSKLYSDGQVDIANQAMINLPSTEEPNFCQVEGDIEGWKYEHDFHARQPYHDSSFSYEVNVLR